MKKWKEYCESISDYYEWVVGDVTDKLAVISYNASGIGYNKEKFWEYCKKELLNDLSMPDSIYLYLIANEKVKSKDSKLEHYKKCWKKISEFFDIQGFELGLEIEHEHNGNCFFSGIAKTTLNSLEDLLKILEFKGKKYVTFMSRRDYFQDISDIKKIISDYSLFDKYEDIDYPGIFHLSKNSHDIICRYGVDSIGAEFAMIIRKDEVDTYMSNKFLFRLNKNASSETRKTDKEKLVIESEKSMCNK